MKAWLVRVEDGDCATVVFAETRGKARALAQCTDACEDADFIDIEVRRVPQLDNYDTGSKIEMDWYNPQDRLALVKECGFQCVDMEWDECKTCSAKEYCDLYQDAVIEEKERKEFRESCKHYDKELDCCKWLSDWSEPMPIIQPCLDSPCIHYTPTEKGGE